MAKAMWKPVGQTATVPVFDTGVSGLTKVFKAINTPWDAAKSGDIAPNDDDIVLQSDTKGNKWGLVALHLSTKEIRDWVWSTYWWSSNDAATGANADFGADRDVSGFTNESVRNQFSHYKMCTVVDFDENDDLTKRYDVELADPNHAQHSLAKALVAAHDLVNKAPGGIAKLAAPNAKVTWCSNPHVESHPGNSHTNCIGCHQHTGVDFNATFYNTTDKEAWSYFPQYGGSRIRSTFPSDFSWALQLHLQGDLSDVLRSRKVAP
jgi:hypothetical protein